MDVPAADNHTIGIDTALTGDGLLQRRVAIGAVPVNLERGLDGQFGERERSDAASGEIVARTALGLGPMHVIGMSLSHEFGWVRARRLQYQYTGMPVSRMQRPMTLSEG